MSYEIFEEYLYYKLLIVYLKLNWTGYPIFLFAKCGNSKLGKIKGDFREELAFELGLKG